MLELTANCAQQELLLSFAKRLESAKHGEKNTILAEVEQAL